MSCHVNDPSVQSLPKGQTMFALKGDVTSLDIVPWCVLRLCMEAPQIWQEVLASSSVPSWTTESFRTKCRCYACSFWHVWMTLRRFLKIDMPQFDMIWCSADCCLLDCLIWQDIGTLYMIYLYLYYIYIIYIYYIIFIFVTWIRSYKHWLIHFLRCMILNRWTPHPLQIFNVCFMKRFFLDEKCGYYLKIETMYSQLYRIMEIFITRQQRLQTRMATYSSHRTTVPQYWWRFDEETKKWKKDRASLKIWNLEKGWRQYKVRCHWARKSWISKPPLMIGIRSREMVCSRIFRACHKLEAACTSSWLLVATCFLNAGFSIPFMAAETSLVVWSCKMLQYLPQDEDITVASEYQEEVHLDRTRGLIPGT